MNPCGHQTRHTERITCCSGCREMFTSDSAWSRHRKALTCLFPPNVGLVPKPSRTAPGETLWALPASDREWTAPDRAVLDKHAGEQGQDGEGS